MAARFENRILESSTSTGTDSFALQAVPGWRRFADALAVGETCHYVITAVDAVGRATGEAEWGIGTVAANNTLARTTVIGSSNGGAKVVFAEGAKTVALTALAPVTAPLQADWRAAIGLDKVDNTSDKLKPVSDSTKDALDAKVARTGSEMSGTLAIHNEGPVLALSKTGNGAAAIVGQKNRVTRWSVELGNGTPETGGSAGSNLTFNRCNDAGTYIDTPLQIIRATGETSVKTLNASGNLNVTGRVTTGALTVDKSSGLTVSGWAPDGNNFYNQVLYFNPGWDSVSFQGYHQSGVWAGARLIVGSTNPAVFEFRNNGSLYTNGVALTSDRRLKTNIAPIEDAWDKIDLVEGCTYDRTDMHNAITGKVPRMAGLIAQDFQKAVPEAVVGTESETEFLHIDQSGPPALLVQFARAAKARIVAQQALIDDLVTRLEALERR